MIKENNKHSVLPKGNGMENNEYMSHKVSYKWFRRTQYITSIGLDYKNWEDCGGLSDL